MSLQRERTLFGGIPEKNVYFLIDTSGSMYHQLGFVKNHLFEVLTRHAVVSQDTMFNIIEFKEDTNKFAESLVKCTPETVNIAAQWISNFTCGTSTNTMSALLQAFSDTAVEAVYLVTDGLPDQRPTVILDKLASMSSTIPVHCIYLKGTYSDPAACDFLLNLAKQTCGSLHIVKLSRNGKVEQFLTIHNSKTTNVQDCDVYSDFSTPIKSAPYIDLNTPANSEYSRRLYSKPTKLQTENNLAPFPRALGKDPTLEYSDRNGLNSNALDYADALIKARCLAQSVGIRCSSTPVASSLMKGVKVLARLDRDGLYYLGQVKDQGPNESFVIKFERCPAMRKTTPQEISVHNMIAYKDAERLNISLGDKVLAPWQRDGRYGPGTVLDGYERRNTRNEGDDGGELLVTFFNGQTVSLPRGVAIRIPEKKYERISSDLLLPESQRRKQRLREESHTVASGSYSWPRPRMVWEDERRELQLENEKLQQKLDEQIKETNDLLNALELNATGSAKSTRDSCVIGRATSRDLNATNETTPNRDSLLIGRAMSRDLDIANVKKPKNISPVIGKATSRDLIGEYDSGVFSDEDSGRCSEENSADRTSPYSEISQVDVRDFDKDYDLAVTPRFSLPDKKVPSKRNGKIEPTQQWRYSGGGVPAMLPRFRETALAKPREPGEKSTERPTHEEYQTVDGISFPAGTDRKFEAKPQKWHPYRQFGDGKRKENISAIWERKHLKHSEYQDSSGVKFPPSTDRKFTRSLDPNWSPDTTLRNAERSRNWEDGLGHGDAEKNARYADKLERMRSNKRRYFKDIEDKVAIEEGKEEKKVEFRRNKMAERKEDMAEAEVEQDRIKTARLETRRAKQAEIAKHEKERTEKAEKWKTDRIEAMKERQVKFAEIESGHEEKTESKMARRQAYLRMREHERREQFHDRLREEWRTEDERDEYLRRRSEANREKQDVRSKDAVRAKEARLSAKRERMERYRASVLP